MIRLFNPPHCPNPDCACHPPHTDTNNEGWFVRRGFRRLRQNGEYRAALFICKQCGRCFSENSFRGDYYEKVTISAVEIIRCMKPGITLRDWADALNTTPPTLKLRLHKLCWTLVERLDEYCVDSGLISRALCDCQRLLTAGEGEFVVLRELIVRLRRLFVGGYGRCFFGGNRGSWGDEKEVEGGKQNLLTTLWLLSGRWRYPMPPDHIWYPVYPTLWQTKHTHIMAVPMYTPLGNKLNIYNR